LVKNTQKSYNPYIVNNNTPICPMRIFQKSKSLPVQQAFIIVPLKAAFIIAFAVCGVMGDSSDICETLIIDSASPSITVKKSDTAVLREIPSDSFTVSVRHYSLGASTVRFFELQSHGQNIELVDERTVQPSFKPFNREPNPCPSGTVLLITSNALMVVGTLATLIGYEIKPSEVGNSARSITPLVPGMVLLAGATVQIAIGVSFQWRYNVWERKHR
jgi:hypothetical protein